MKAKELVNSEWFNGKGRIWSVRKTGNEYYVEGAGSGRIRSTKASEIQSEIKKQGFKPFMTGVEIEERANKTVNAWPTKLEKIGR